MDNKNIWIASIDDPFIGIPLIVYYVNGSGGCTYDYTNSISLAKEIYSTEGKETLEEYRKLYLSRLFEIEEKIEDFDNKTTDEVFSIIENALKEDYEETFNKPFNKIDVYYVDYKTIKNLLTETPRQQMEFSDYLLATLK